MEHQTVSRSSHDNETSFIVCGAQRLTIKTAPDISGLKRPVSEDALAGLNNPGLNYQEFEHQYRQRWKIE